MIPVNRREDVIGFPPGFSGTRVAVFSWWNDKYAPLADIARPNWKEYCERNEYALRFYPGMYHEDPSRLATYGDKGKFELFFDIRGHCDIAMFLDIDSLFTNMNIRIEDTLIAGYQSEGTVKETWGSEALKRRFLWTHDASGPLSGLWIARTDETTEAHLRFAYERAAIENNVRHGVIEPNGISDQDSMTRLMNIPPFSSTFKNCFSAESIGHSYEHNHKSGDWVVTFPGIPVKEKRQKMEAWSEQLSTTV